MKGNIFNIQKFSIHDGPGVRTTVFFKGCPLRCKWCANPESQEKAVQITYDRRKCIACRTCVHICPKQCFSPQIPDNSNGAVLMDKKNCTGCLSCVGSCPARALQAEGQQVDLEQVVFTCLQDIDFYEESGGGVTFSGGECMCQPEFAEALILALKKHKLHVAAETTGYIEETLFQHLAPLFDLLLFDIKHFDSEQHFTGTGVHNALIIRNLTWAQRSGIAILPRIPVIPGFNATSADAGGLAELLLKTGLTEVQLLPFHQFGERKYELLNQEYSLKHVKALYPEDLTEYQQIFQSKGIHCFI